MQLQTQLRTLYASNKLPRIFEVLQEELLPEGDLYDDYLHLCQRYNALLDKEMAGTIRPEEANIEQNQIGKALLSFINKLRPDALQRQPGQQHTTITNPLLVLCAPEQEPDSLQQFFTRLRFSAATVQPWQEDLQPDEYDLVIFDNTDLPFCPSDKMLEGMDKEVQQRLKQRVGQMDQVLEQSSRFVVHYGEHLYWVNHHRDRVHAANSRFSLYARIREMLDFINTYRV